MGTANVYIRDTRNRRRSNSFAATYGLLVGTWDYPYKFQESEYELAALWRNPPECGGRRFPCRCTVPWRVSRPRRFRNTRNKIHANGPFSRRK